MFYGLLLQGLVSLKRLYGFLLAVDEAHATLVCGANGGGAAEMMGVGADVDVHIGTLSKAVGAQVGTCGYMLVLPNAL
jgi:8-amino-7-oxononanoate synthase